MRLIVIAMLSLLLDTCIAVLYYRSIPTPMESCAEQYEKVDPKLGHLLWTAAEDYKKPPYFIGWGGDELVSDLCSRINPKRRLPYR
jgi:hypothetical protein